MGEVTILTFSKLCRPAVTICSLPTQLTLYNTTEQTFFTLFGLFWPFSHLPKRFWQGYCWGLRFQWKRLAMTSKEIVVLGSLCRVLTFSRNQQKQNLKKQEIIGLCLHYFSILFCGCIVTTYLRVLLGI